MAGYLMDEEFKAQVEATVRAWMQRNASLFKPPIPQRSSDIAIHLAKSTSAISKGSTGDMTVYFRNSSGTPVISSPVVTLEDVMAELGAYTANKLAYVIMIGGEWVILSTECAS